MTDSLFEFLRQKSEVERFWETMEWFHSRDIKLPAVQVMLMQRGLTEPKT